MRAGTGPANGSSNRRIRFAVTRGSSRSHRLIRSRHGSRLLGRGGDLRTGGVGRPMARRTVLTSSFNRRATSFFGTPSTRCMWRIWAHWNILITSASSWLGRRDDLSRPVHHRQGIAVFRVLRGVPFQVATESLFMLPLPSTSARARSVITARTLPDPGRTRHPPARQRDPAERNYKCRQRAGTPNTAASGRRAKRSGAENRTPRGTGRTAADERGDGQGQTASRPAPEAALQAGDDGRQFLEDFDHQVEHGEGGALEKGELRRLLGDADVGGGHVDGVEGGPTEHAEHGGNYTHRARVRSAPARRLAETESGRTDQQERGTTAQAAHAATEFSKSAVGDGSAGGFGVNPVQAAHAPTRQPDVRDRAADAGTTGARQWRAACSARISASVFDFNSPGGIEFRSADRTGKLHRPAEHLYRRSRGRGGRGERRRQRRLQRRRRA